jgi:hypothetical protein
MAQIRPLGETPLEDQVRQQIRGVLRLRHISHAEAGRVLGIGDREVGRMLSGHAALTLAWAERLADLCGMRLVIGFQAIDPE